MAIDATILKDCPVGMYNCPFHDDTKPSLSVFWGKDGMRHWKCFSGCGTGIIPSPHGVTGEDYWLIQNMVSKSEEKSPEVVSAELEEVADAYYPGWCGTPDLLRGRKISADTANCYKIGYRNWDVHTRGGFEWTIPIRDKDNLLVAIKIHRQNMPDKSPKCYWYKLDGRSSHGVQTLWPRPEEFKRGETLYLCVGELKALRMISAGYQATSITGGESQHLTDDEVARLFGFRVTVVFDYDDAGVKFRDHALKALCRFGLAVTSMTCEPQEVEH